MQQPPVTERTSLSLSLSPLSFPFVSFRSLPPTSFGPECDRPHAARKNGIHTSEFMGPNVFNSSLPIFPLDQVTFRRPPPPPSFFSFDQLYTTRHSKWTQTKTKSNKFHFSWMNKILKNLFKYLLTMCFLIWRDHCVVAPVCVVHATTHHPGVRTG